MGQLPLKKQREDHNHFQFGKEKEKSIDRAYKMYEAQCSNNARLKLKLSSRKGWNISHNLHTILNAYIESTNIIIPECIIHMILAYSMIQHCFMLYSINNDNKCGKIQLIDTQNPSNILLTLSNNEYINHRMGNYRRVFRFIPNIKFPNYKPNKTFKCILYAKNIIRGGMVEAILINPMKPSKIECKLELPFVNDCRSSKSAKEISHFLYSHTLHQLITQNYDGDLDILSFDKYEYDECRKYDDNFKWKWKHFKTKKFDPLSNRSCYRCFIGDHEDLIFGMGSSYIPIIFDLNALKWRYEYKLSPLPSIRIRNKFGLCYDNGKCFIAAGRQNKFATKQTPWSDYYDFEKNKWYKLPNLNVNNYNESPLLWVENNLLYISGKYIGNGQNRASEYFDFRCNQWMTLSSHQRFESFQYNDNSPNASSCFYTPTSLMLCDL